MAVVLQRWWLLFAFVLLNSDQALSHKRRCGFQVQPHNHKYYAAGNVSGSEQYCEFTDCCVGYFLIKDGELEVDTLACGVAESCLDLSCTSITLVNRHIFKCVCNTDLCNNNITWNPESEQSLLLNYSYVEILVAGLLIGLGLILLCVILLCVVAAKFLWKETREYPDSSLCEPLCSCLTNKPSEIEIADIELLQIVCKGTFASVWQGKYRGTQVAVKVFSAAWKQKFTAEKEVYELPLMTHAGIVHFLGSGSRRGCGVIVLQYAKYGSLHCYLSTHTYSWKMSLTLCQSLSQGLSFLHSDLHKQGVRKPPVAHRDLSSSNVLVRADGTCALSDFGCSAILCSCSGQYRRPFNSRKIEVQSPVGTLRYMSPEILEGSVNLNNDWCLQGDVYSLGLVMWEIWMRCLDLFGEMVPQHLLPYECELGTNVTLESLIQYVFYMDKRPTIPEVWEQHPQGAALQELLSSCWDCDADARLSAACVVDRLASLQSQ